MEKLYNPEKLTIENNASTGLVKIFMTSKEGLVTILKETKKSFTYPIGLSSINVIAEVYPSQGENLKCQ